MYEIKIKVAGVAVCISSRYEYTYKLCQKYRTEEETAFSINADDNDIAYENAMIEKDGLYNYGDDVIEFLAIHRKLTEKLFDYGIILLHGSAIEVDNNGYVFIAKSGTGKSTHTALWRRLLGNKAVMINDDKPYIRFAENDIYVCGSPWNGVYRLGCNKEVRLKAICILNRDSNNHIEKTDGTSLYKELLKRVYKPKTKAKLIRFLEYISRLSSEVSAYKLYCNMDISAAEIAYNALIND